MPSILSQSPIACQIQVEITRIPMASGSDFVVLLLSCMHNVWKSHRPSEILVGEICRQDYSGGQPAPHLSIDGRKDEKFCRATCPHHL